MCWSAFTEKASDPVPDTAFATAFILIRLRFQFRQRTVTHEMGKVGSMDPCRWKCLSKNGKNKKFHVWRPWKSFYKGFTKTYMTILIQKNF